MSELTPFNFFLNLNTETKTEKPGKTKKPGRPRKVQQKVVDPKLGIVSEPTINNALFELYYSNPVALGKALGFYLQLSDTPLHCKYTKNTISYLALDRYKKSTIKISGDPTKFNRYYCNNDSIVQFGISGQYLELLVKKIKSHITTVTWYGIEDKNDETYLDFFSPKYKITRHETLICCGKYQQMEDIGFDDSDYNIKFQLDARSFKELLSNAKSYGDQLTIRQTGADFPLMFIYSNSNGHAKSEEIFEGKKEMKFFSNIKQGEIFNISVQIKYWYPVANSTILDSIVQISLHKDKPIMTTVLLDDGALSIKVLTSINDIRQDSDIVATITSRHTPKSTNYASSILSRPTSANSSPIVSPRDTPILPKLQILSSVLSDTPKSTKRSTYEIPE